MSFFGREVIKTKHAGYMPTGRMSDARKHFHLGNEIIKAVGVNESDIDECDKLTSTIIQTNPQGDFLTITISFGHTALVSPFLKKFTKLAKRLEREKTPVEAFIRKNEFLGFRVKN